MKRRILVWLLPLWACCDRVLRHNEDLDQSPGRGDTPHPSADGGTECLNKDCKIKGLHASCAVSGPKRGLADAKRCMAHVKAIMDDEKPDIDFEAIERLENSLAQTEVKASTSMQVGHMVALLLKPRGRLPGLHISASDNEANAGAPVNNSRVNVHLPGDLLPGSDDSLLFCMVTWPRSLWVHKSIVVQYMRRKLIFFYWRKQKRKRLLKCAHPPTTEGVAMFRINQSHSKSRFMELRTYLQYFSIFFLIQAFYVVDVCCSPLQNVTSEELYQNRLLGLRLRGKTVSGLRQRVNITVNTVVVNETQSPKCAFLNFSTKAFSSSGCRTIWEPGQSHVTCSCDHLTYFGILLVSAPLSDADEAVLSYLSLIGCTLSLISLVITLLLFIAKRKLREDVSMKVHANLAVALILLNAHFLSSRAAALSPDGICFYVALALHYSLLTTFSWMALESFHLYLLLVRVFNIYIRRYMLKLGLAGWGLPAAIVILAVFVKPDAYGRVALDAADPESTQICYLLDGTLKMVSTLGVFSVVFAFNFTMLVVTVQRLTGLPHSKRIGQGERGRAKQNISTLLGVSTLLGITWGLVFFSFGHLSTAGLYLFCILNSLQGFFIFLWFVLSWRKSAPSAASSKTPSASS
ncbi:adhesion G-protein coupled receptor G5-like [Hippocampus zosterae]|uniref:adhesion G-protein coupled receptor G5-like n=1 Tax=Hippocampus zosterae TaxID=109293 RepID=UPI00223E2F89|nr:adhesion G-protein coupled receptor G5-like [Hippocampus zosterae]